MKVSWNAMNEIFLKVQKRAEEIKAQYESSSSSFSNFLIYGDFGTGKTQIASTCPTPVFIDSFDPGGTKTAALQPLISSGDIIVESRWETDRWRDPFAYRAWEKEMAARRKIDFFSHIGTYMLDSITKWADSMMWEITRAKGRKGQNPQLQDYLAQQLTAVDELGILMSLPCHVIVTGHIGTQKDEATGKLETSLMLSNKFAEKVPLVFDEKYVARAIESKGESEYLLLTKNNGYYKAETRMGGTTFDQLEKPDIRALLRKAKKDASNRPSLFEEKKDE
jgi:hypothetical protein